MDHHSGQAGPCYTAEKNFRTRAHSRVLVKHVWGSGFNPQCMGRGKDLPGHTYNPSFEGP